MVCLQVQAIVVYKISVLKPVFCVSERGFQCKEAHESASDSLNHLQTHIYWFHVSRFPVRPITILFPPRSHFMSLSIAHAIL